MPPKRVLRFRLLQGDEVCRQTVALTAPETWSSAPDLSDVHDFLRAKLNVAQVEVCDDLAHPFMDDTIDLAQEYVVDLGSSKADSQVFRKFARGTGTMPLSSLARAASGHAAAGADTKDQGAAIQQAQPQVAAADAAATHQGDHPGNGASTPLATESSGAASSCPPPPPTAATAGAAAGASTQAAMHCDVFISHAGEQKYGLVSHVELRLREHHPELSVFVDYTMQGGDGAREEIQERLRHAKGVVVVLSRAFVRKPFPMAELALALEGAAHGQVLVLVLAPCLPFKAAKALEREYAADSSWPEGRQKPQADTLAGWADAVRRLLRGRSTLLASQFLVEAALVQQVAADVVHQLAAAGHRIARAPILPLPRVVLDFENRRGHGIAALLRYRAVLLQGMPGVGKTTLAMDVARAAAHHDALRELTVAMVRLAPEMSAQDVAKEQEGLLRCLVPVAH